MNKLPLKTNHTHICSKPSTKVCPFLPQRHMTNPHDFATPLTVCVARSWDAQAKQINFKLKCATNFLPCFVSIRAETHESGRVCVCVATTCHMSIVPNTIAKWRHRRVPIIGCHRNKWRHAINCVHVHCGALKQIARLFAHEVTT